MEPSEESIKIAYTEENESLKVLAYSENFSYIETEDERFGWKIR